MSIMRKVWKVSPKAGSFDNLGLSEEEIDGPGLGEVSVEVKASGLNFADVFAIKGLYSATPKGEFIPGLEFSGIVKSVGAGVENFKPGQRVMGVSRFGGYASLINTKVEYITPLPDSWSYSQGAAYLVQVLTAYYGLVSLGNIQLRDTVLIHSAAGGVGIWANRIAKHYDAYTIGTVGSSAKGDFLQKEGFDDFIVRGSDFADQLKSKLGDRELKVVMECIGGKILKEGYDQLGVEGRLITYGSAHFAQQNSKPNKLKLLWKFLQRPKIDPMQMIHLNKGILGFNLIYLFNNADKMKSILSALSQMDIGAPVVGHEFAFTEARQAIDLFQSGKTMGKVVLLHG